MPLHWIESTEDGQKLIRRLAIDAALMYEEGEDPLTAGLRSLFSCIQFLETSPGVRIIGLTRPLRKIAYAVRDTAQGAKPPLLFGRTPKRKGAPSATNSDLLHALLAAALEVLVRCGEDLQSARQFVANAASRRKMTHRKGKPIEAMQIQRWRDSINASASPQTNEVYTGIIADLVQEGVIPDKGAKATDVQIMYARDTVENLIWSAWIAGF
jgi:hypothetical protein